jgi:hypothetical protein
LAAVVIFSQVGVDADADADSGTFFFPQEQRTKRIKILNLRSGHFTSRLPRQKHSSTQSGFGLPECRIISFCVTFASSHHCG